MSEAQQPKIFQGTAAAKSTGVINDGAGNVGSRWPKSFLKPLDGRKYFVANGEMSAAVNELIRNHQTLEAIDVCQGGYIFTLRKKFLHQSHLL